MKSKILIFIVSVLFIIGVSSCNDNSFLKESPTSFYTADNSYNTVSQVEASVTNMYVHIRYWFQIDDYMKGLGTDYFDTPYWRCSGNGYSNYSTWNASNSNVLNIWNAFYMLVSYANETLEGASDSTKVKWDNSSEYNYVIAQAKFFRGFSYLTLGELFGGVPLVDKFYTTPKYDFTRSTRDSTYKFAINDLENAVSGMPDYPSEAGKVAKGATYHYLAEAYLALATINNNNKTYLDKSIAYATKAMNLHSLMTSRFGTRATSGSGTAMNGVAAYYPSGDVFFDLFQRGNLDYCEGNNEALWTLENDYSVYLKYGGDNYLPYPRNFSPVLRNVHWNSQYTGTNASPWQGLTTAYVGGRGVSSVRPTEYAIDSIWAGKYASDIRNSAVNIRRKLVCMDPSSKYYGDTITTAMIDPATKEYMSPLWTKLAPIDDWGYEDLSNGGNRSNMYRDDYACRLAETYLLRAEAYYREGDLTDAAADINVLRKRAQCAYLVSPTDISLNLILDERARELFSEERRWCTLLRMGGTVAVDRIKKYSYFAGTTSSYYQGTSAQPKDWNLFPIPQSIIDSNTGATLTQNSGY
jgi:starch-binding outer membrane protein, SusD/RagB family